MKLRVLNMIIKIIKIYMKLPEESLKRIFIFGIVKTNSNIFVHNNIVKIHNAISIILLFVYKINMLFNRTATYTSGYRIYYI